MTFPKLERLIRAQFALDCDGIHGAAHWARVRDNGLRLAALTKAKPEVVALFALLHDSRRLNNEHDPQHGPRAARYARSLAGSAFQLEAPDLDLLADACHGHSDGLMTGDITVLTCWDADRLDLGRVGVRPNPERLCTQAAREPGLLDWAYRRSTQQTS
jgi:uncharacterized protein